MGSAVSEVIARMLRPTRQAEGGGGLRAGPADAGGAAAAADFGQLLMQASCAGETGSDDIRTTVQAGRVVEGETGDDAGDTEPELELTQAVETVAQVLASLLGGERTSPPSEPVGPATTFAGNAELAAAQAGLTAQKDQPSNGSVVPDQRMQPATGSPQIADKTVNAAPVPQTQTVTVSEHATDNPQAAAVSQPAVDEFAIAATVQQPDKPTDVSAATQMAAGRPVSAGARVQKEQTDVGQPRTVGEQSRGSRAGLSQFASVLAEQSPDGAAESAGPGLAGTVSGDDAEQAVRSAALPTVSVGERAAGPGSAGTATPGGEIDFDHNANAARIVRAVRVQTDGGSGGLFSLRLDPPGLGSVRVQLSLTEQTVHLTLLPADESAVRLLSDGLGLLRQSLQSHGLTVGRMAVQEAPTGQPSQPSSDGTFNNGQSFNQGSDRREQDGRQGPDRWVEWDDQTTQEQAAGPGAAGTAGLDTMG